jgi:RND family efflux transporter MFP subunit
MTMRLLGALALLALLAAAFTGLSGAWVVKVTPGEVPRAERGLADCAVATVVTLRTPEYVEAVGTLAPRCKTTVASQVQATVREVQVQAGDRVTPGQLLATLDDRELQAQRREMAAASVAAEAELTLHRRDLARFQTLLASRAVSPAEHDRAEEAFQAAQAGLRRVKEQEARCDVLLSYTRITAPGAGVIADRFADPGDLVGPGRPLFAVYDPRELELHATVRERLAGALQPGLPLRVHVEAGALDLVGTVREVVPQAQEASRSVLFKVALAPERTAGLHAGMFGRVAVPNGTRDRTVAPRVAVHQVGQLELAEVVTPGGRLERRLVQTGRDYGDQVEVLSGLNVGEKVALPRRPESAAEVEPYIATTGAQP